MVLLPLLTSNVRAHGTLQIPFPWSQGNLATKWEYPNVMTTWAEGYHVWFSNYTHLPADVTATINDPNLRTYTDQLVDGRMYDWTARFPWRAPGTAKVYSPCGIEGGNPNGCLQSDGSMGPCVTDGGGYGYGIDGLSLAGNGITTFWEQGSAVEVGWSNAANHGGGYAYRLCKTPANGNFSGEVTEECFQKTHLDFVGDTSFVQYTNGSGRFEIDAARTSKGTFPAASMWTRNPIPNVGHGADAFPKGKHPGTQFPLPTLHGKPSSTPSRLSGYTPLAGAADPDTQSFNPSMGDWILVDRVQLPKSLAPGDYVLSFRWDCEQTPQVWQQCASVTIIAPKPGVPSPAPKPAPLCGDERHGCCFLKAADGTCSGWEAVNFCQISKQHCENATQAPGTHWLGASCNGHWMPEASKPEERCSTAASSDGKHVCGIDCAKGAPPAPVPGIPDATALTPQCNGFMSPLHACSKTKLSCELECKGKWLLLLAAA